MAGGAAASQPAARGKVGGGAVPLKLRAFVGSAMDGGGQSERDGASGRAGRVWMAAAGCSWTC